MQAVIFDLDDTLFTAEDAPHDGVKELLIILRRLGHQLGALSSSDHRAVVRLSEAGLSNHFDKVVCSDHIADSKGPKGVLHLLNILGVDRHNTTLVSHSHGDIILGKHAGLARTIHVAHGPIDVSHFAKADHLVEDIPSVLDVLYI